VRSQPLCLLKARAVSLRYAHELDVPGLRCWPLRRYPHLVFFVERDDHIDVWRILHAERDIPAWMGGPQSD
jgi:toxin ParE1/3/4